LTVAARPLSPPDFKLADLAQTLRTLALKVFPNLGPQGREGTGSRVAEILVPSLPRATSQKTWRGPLLLFQRGAPLAAFDLLAGPRCVHPDTYARLPSERATAAFGASRIVGELQRAYKRSVNVDRAGHSDKESIMRQPLLALAVVGSLAAATVAAPTQAHAQWRGWGWGGLGLGLGLLAGAAIASSAYGYGYGYPAYGYGYGYPAYASYGYGYPAYGYSYPGYTYASYGYAPGYYGGGWYGGYRPAYRGYRVARRAAIYRARWR